MNEQAPILTKKNSQNSLNYKTDEEIKAHFLSRLKERYDISLTDEQYINIHHPKGFESSNVLTEVMLWANLSANKKIFIIKIQNKNILVLYSRRRGRFITALPWAGYDDETRFVPIKLKKKDLKEEAIKRYREILSICSKEYVDLGNGKENHFFYQKCSYPDLLTAEYKGNLAIWKIYREVEKELLGK